MNPILGGFPRLIMPALLSISMTVNSTSAFAQETIPDEKSEQAEFLAAAQQYTIRLPTLKEDAELHEPSLLNFTNPERNQERGAVFVWMHQARPVVVGQFFCFNNNQGRRTKHAFHSLSQEPVVAALENQVRWTPKQPGIIWQNIPDAPEPAKTHSARLLQMRQLARRYRLTLTNNKNEKTELRLISRPLFDYEPMSAGVLSGAVFSFVIATDPESLLLLEAHTEGGRSGYRCGFARLHFQQIVAIDGEQDVWRVDYDPSLMVNQPGNPATMNKIYNSFYH
ncbi:MAG: hypothetical protein Q8K78_15595 [Planctomycetaceae bacterium]|nr:hypothetical protein [Planctomycetaceae bacterium]